MRAVTFAGVESVVVGTKPPPEVIEPTDAIVRVELAGLCGSDLHPYFGREAGLDLGTTMGHEFVGSIASIGAEVARFQVGDAVLSPFSVCCGGCDRCDRRVSARCRHSQLFGWVESGHGLEGAQAEWVRVPLADATLVGRPDDLSRIDALLLGDVVSTGYYAVKRAAVEGRAVAVVGLGAVGLASVLFARLLGAAKVFALDPVAERMVLAERWDAEPIPVATDPAWTREALLRANGGEGVTVAIEAVGSSTAMRTAVEILEPGGFLSVASVHTEPSFPFTPIDAYDRNLTVAMGRCPVRSFLEELIALQRSERLPLEALVTHRFSLGDAPDAYRTFGDRQRGLIKAVFDPTV
ncbi:MAG: alcohol dehydrogenase catalytic domain-containing protein [Planctomycetota bacterium]